MRPAIIAGTSPKMKANWYPVARKMSWGRDGGSMVGGPPRGVLHETITAGVPTYNQGASAPHFTIGRSGSVFQHSPCGRAARALRNMAGGVQTNRQGTACIQVEMVAYSDKNDWTAPQVAALRNLVEWCRVEWAIPARFPLPQGGGEQYGLKNPLELSPDEWVAFTGWCAHQHVPENTHWDIGRELAVKAVFQEDGTLGDMTPQDIAILQQLVDSIKRVGSNGTFAEILIEDYRERTAQELATIVVIPDNPTVMGTAYTPQERALTWAQRVAREHNSPYDDTNIGLLVKWYYLVGGALGVRPDLALAQSAKETGYWAYKGDVTPWQWNFAGIGATGGVSGTAFPDLPAGVRAHVQRMKLYAVNDPSLNSISILGRTLDPKHWGKYPRINDFNGVWAYPGTNYGQSIVENYLRKM